MGEDTGDKREQSMNKLVNDILAENKWWKRKKKRENGPPSPPGPAVGWELAEKQRKATAAANTKAQGGKRLTRGQAPLVAPNTLGQNPENLVQ